MRQMKDSGIEWIGEIPESWKVLCACQCFSQVKNKNEGLSETNLLSLSYGKLKRKSMDTTEGLLPESFESYNIIEAGDIVLRLTDLQNDHTSLRVGLSKERGIITSAYVTLRNYSKNVPKYLYYYLHSYDIAKGFYGMGAGVRQGLNWEGLKHLKVLAPMPQEQHLISAYLDRQCTLIDSVIEKTKASIEEYKKLRQAVITQAVTKGVRGDRAMKDSGIEWIGEICSDYSINRLKFLLLEPLMYGANESGEPFNERLPRYIRITDINMNGTLKETGRLSLNEETAQNYLLDKGDILFARSGGTVGKAFIFKSEYGKSAFAGYLIRARMKKSIVPKYIYYYTQSSIYEEWKKQTFIQSTIQNIGADRYNQLPIITQSFMEQQEIAEYLDKKCAEIDSLITKKEQFLTELDTYKKSLIYEYVTGKKEVPQA